MIRENMKLKDKVKRMQGEIERLKVKRRIHYFRIEKSSWSSTSKIEIYIDI